MARNKPLPHPAEASLPFRDGLQAHRVRLQQCEDCGHWFFFPRAHCPACASRRLAWRGVSGEGTLCTFTVARVPTLPEFTDELPQLLAVVQLDERLGEATLLRSTPVASDHPRVIGGEAAAAASTDAAV